MITLDPPGTLKQVAALCFLFGAAWALFAAAAIYLGSTCLKPKIPRRRIWAEWRQRRMVWGLSLVLGGVATYFSSEWVVAGVALRDLYWVTRKDTAATIGYLGGYLGYLAVLFGITLASLLARRRERRRAGDRRPRR